MEEKQDLTQHFLEFYPKTLDKSRQTKDPFEKAVFYQQSIYEMYQASCSLDNRTTCSILQGKLRQYNEIIKGENGSSIYVERLKNLLKTMDHKPVQIQSNLKNFQVPSCEKCEVPSRKNLPEVLRAFPGKKDKPALVPSKSVFKTAKDELALQSSRRGDQEAGGTKRKLGTRRNINSKFISPMLSASGSKNDVKSEELPEPVDERLKNIDSKMIELIKSEIMDSGPKVTWDDIAGLEFAKTAIQEAVVWPMLRPDIFTGLRRPPKGILLFGPPGTGKTLIGKCVASQSKSTFFSISASSLTSKWVGDGEKMVRALFSVARVHQPAVIFIDEIDSLLSQRSDQEHESSRRIKTEFLVQLDGATTDSEERIMVIGATNRPQELDEAARRRFVKRLYIPLPNYQARLELVRKLMSSERHDVLEEDLEEIARLSDGYSGADIRIVCSEASMGPIRAIEFHRIESVQSGDVRPVSMGDFQQAFSRVRSSVSGRDLEQYVVWNTTYGSGC